MKITKENVHEVYKAFCNKLCCFKNDNILIDFEANLHVIAKSDIEVCIACLRQENYYDNLIHIPNINKIVKKSGIDLYADVYLTPDQFSQTFNIDIDDILLWICQALEKMCLKHNIGYYIDEVELGYEVWKQKIKKIKCLEELLIDSDLNAKAA